MKSIIQNNVDHCFMCLSNSNLETHHVIGGAHKTKSEYYGLLVKLCPLCHRVGKHAVHNNRQNMDRLRALAHVAFEGEYSDLDWLRTFGRNYNHLLEDEGGWGK